MSVSYIYNTWNHGLKERSDKKNSPLCERTAQTLFATLYSNYKTKIRMTKVRKM